MTNIPSREKLYELYSQTSFDKSNRVGEITIINQDQLDLLRNVFLHSGETGWSIGLNDLEIGKTIIFNHELPNPNIYGAFYYDFHDFIYRSANKIKEPVKYYISSIKWSDIDSGEAPKVMDKYKNVLKLVKILEGLSLFFDTAQSKIVFIDGESKLDVNVDFSEEDLDLIQIDFIEKITDFLKENAHLSQKKAILSKAIVSNIRSIDKEKQFSHILSNLNKIYEDSDNNYAVFASNFSFDKIINDIENTKLEEQVKIHKVFTDIQSQILGIPIATVIVATQFKLYDGNNPSYQFWVNTGILLGVVIFSILMIFVINNQKDTLKAIGLELKRKQDKLQAEFPKIAQTDPFKDLRKRQKVQCIALFSVLAVTCLGGFVTVIIYFFITKFPDELMKIFNSVMRSVTFC